MNLRLLVRNQAGLSSSTRIERTALKLAQFNNLSLNFVTFRKHSAQKLSKTILTDPSGVLNVNELKRENVLIGASYYALPISHLKWQTVLEHRKTPKPWSIFGADFAVHYRRYGSRARDFEPKLFRQPLRWATQQTLHFAFTDDAIHADLIHFLARCDNELRF